MHIPKHLLIHSVILKQQKGVDRNRNPVYEESWLCNVRVGVTRRVQTGQHGVIRADTMTLFVDVFNSKRMQNGQRMPLVLLQENDAVVFEGKEYTIKSVTPFWAGYGDARHYEAVLE